VCGFARPDGPAFAVKDSIQRPRPAWILWQATSSVAVPLAVVLLACHVLVLALQRVLLNKVRAVLDSA